MTLDELENTLPNGFHDSGIRSVSVDYVRRVATIEWTIDLTTPGEPHKEPGSADITVVLRGLKYLAIEAPQPDYPFENTGPIDIVNSYDSAGCDAGERPLVSPELLRASPRQKFANSFFVHNWNSFIHVAADEAELIWAREDAKAQ
jgi:hypothetical protein